jgi:hypothetical protein
MVWSSKSCLRFNDQKMVGLNHELSYSLVPISHPQTQEPCMALAERVVELPILSAHSMSFPWHFILNTTYLNANISQHNFGFRESF